MGVPVVLLVRNFNPRSREGSDMSWMLAHAGLMIISIHAPVKGATRTMQANIRLDPTFQSTNP